MAFPKLNMLSYWFMWPAFIIISISFFVDGGAPANGWTSYPLIASLTMPPGAGFQSPGGAGTGYGQICWLSALLFVGISSMMGSVNYVTTIINLRYARNDPGAYAVDGLVAVYHGDSAGFCLAGSYYRLGSATFGQDLQYYLFPTARNRHDR